ncbi:MAG: DUF1849 family protein [Pseudomonadota bacterium]
MFKRLTSAAAILPICLVPISSVGWEVAPHNAVYELTLAGHPGGGNISALQGTMTLTWDQGCDGWVIEQNYQIHLLDHEGDSIQIGSEYYALESLDGADFSFSSRNLVGGLVDEEYVGEAVLDQDGGRVRYSVPNGLERGLPAGTLFPTEHSLELLERAEAGDRFYVANVFDGSDELGVSEVSSIIGPSFESSEEDTELQSPLLLRPGWPVSMAYFSQSQQTSEPDVELRVEVLDNGVVRTMRLDYGSFAMDADLVFLEPIDQSSC